MRLELAIMGGPGVGVFEDAVLMLTPRLLLAPRPWLALAFAPLITRVGGQEVGDAKGHYNATILAAGVDVCLGGQPDPSLSLYACAGARAGAMLIEGVGFQKNFEDVDLWTAAAGSAQARAWLSDAVGVGAGLTFYVPLAKHVVRVAGTRGLVDQRSELPGVGIAVELGPVFRFF
jgi:hypothetical protein